MSDLYLILRRRLEDVTAWVEIDTATLKTARKALGLSYEAMGRQLNVAAKTWERWEKAGRVPRHDLRRVAEVLELEIDWPAAPPIVITEPAAEADRLGRLEEGVEAATTILEGMERGIEQILERLDAQDERAKSR